MLINVFNVDFMNCNIKTRLSTALVNTLIRENIATNSIPYAFKQRKASQLLSLAGQLDVPGQAGRGRRRWEVILFKVCRAKFIFASTYKFGELCSWLYLPVWTLAGADTTAHTIIAREVILTGGPSTSGNSTYTYLWRASLVGWTSRIVWHIWSNLF